MGATIAKEFIFESFLSPDPTRAFLHGHSYTANPIGLCGSECEPRSLAAT